MPFAVPGARQHVDAEGRFSLLLPDGWQVLEQRTGVSRSVLFRARRHPDASVALSFTAIPPGTDAAAVLSYRRAAEGRGGTEEPISHRAGSISFVGTRWREGAAVTGLFVEELCAVVDSCAVLLRAQVPESDAEVESQVRCVTERLVVHESQAAPGALREEAKPETPTYAVRHQRIRVAVSAAPPVVDVLCELDLDATGAGDSPLRVSLPPYPFVRLGGVALGSTPAPYLHAHEGRLQVVEVPSEALARQDGRVSIEYSIHCGWGEAAQHWPYGVFWTPSELICMGSAWLPRAQGRGRGAVPYTLDVSAPPGHEVVGGGVPAWYHEDAGSVRAHYCGNARHVVFAMRPKASVAAGAAPSGRGGDGVRPPVRIMGEPPGTPCEEIRACLARAANLMEEWVAPEPSARRLCVLFYSGETSHGFGSLLLVGRTFQVPGMPLDLRWLGQSTLRETLLHELAHLWFGGVYLSEEDDSDATHEALAGFFTLRLIGELRGEDAETDLRAALRRQHEAATTLSAHAIPRQYGSRAHAVSGALALDGLRARVGAARFDARLRSYFSQRPAKGGRFSLDELLTALDPP